MPGESQELLSISGLHEVEEDIWSPKWGLKGKVDASVQAAVIRKVDNTSNKAKRSVFAPETAAVDEVEETVAPLEIKTGRAVGLMAHRAQTMLYTLLMEDRYGELTASRDCAAGDAGS
jgi:DNA replication ATP-dependent helicase Dna2